MSIVRNQPDFKVLAEENVQTPAGSLDKVFVALNKGVQQLDEMVNVCDKFVQENLDTISDGIDQGVKKAETIVASAEEAVDASIERLDKIDNQISEVTYILDGVEPLFKDIHNAFREGLNGDEPASEKMSKISNGLADLAQQYKERADLIDGKKMPNAKKCMDIGAEVINLCAKVMGVITKISEHEVTQKIVEIGKGVGEIIKNMGEAVSKSVKKMLGKTNSYSQKEKIKNSAKPVMAVGKSR